MKKTISFILALGMILSLLNISYAEEVTELNIEKVYASASGIQVDFNEDISLVSKEKIKADVVLKKTNGDVISYEPEFSDQSTKNMIYLIPSEDLKIDVPYQLRISAGFGSDSAKTTSEIVKNFKIVQFYKTDFSKQGALAQDYFSTRWYKSVYKIQDERLYMRNYEQSTMTLKEVEDLQDYSIEFDMRLYGQNSHNMTIVMNSTCTDCVFAGTYKPSSITFGYTAGNYQAWWTQKTTGGVSRGYIARDSGNGSVKKFSNDELFQPPEKGDGLTWTTGKDNTTDGAFIRTGEEPASTGYIIDKVGTRGRITEVKAGVKTLKDDYDFLSDYVSATGMDASTVNKTGYFAVGAMANNGSDWGSVSFSDFTVTTTTMLPDDLFDEVTYTKLYASSAGVQVDFTGYISDVSESDIKAHFTLSDEDGTEIDYSASIKNNSVFIEPLESMGFDKVYTLNVSEGFGNQYSKLEQPITKSFKIKMVFKTDFANEDAQVNKKIISRWHATHYKIQDNMYYMRNKDQSTITLPQVFNLEDYSVEFDMALYGKNAYKITTLMNKTTDDCVWYGGVSAKSLEFGWTAMESFGKSNNGVSRSYLAIDESKNKTTKYLNNELFKPTVNTQTSITWSNDSNNFTKTGTEEKINRYIIDKLGTRGRLTEIKDGVKAVKDDCDYIDYYTENTGLDASTVNKTGYFSIGSCASGNADYGTTAFGDFTVTTTELLQDNTVYVNDSVLYDAKNIFINLTFDEFNTTKSISSEDITKENIVLKCGRKDVDYILTPVVENDKVTGVKIALNNDFMTDSSYDLAVKIGDNCNFEAVYSIPKPIEAENILLKDSNGKIIDKVSDVSDGKIVFTGNIKNNTYKQNKVVKIITAIYNDSQLYNAKITNADIEIGDTYFLNAEMSVPTENLNEKWNTAVYVWEDDVITPLTFKQSKTYGIDALNDTTKDITAAFIGGSITQGNHYTNPFVETWQSDRTGKITLINAGVGGTDTRYGTMRLYEDVLSKEPDIVFVEFTLNDLTLYSSAMIKRNVESIIRQAYNAEHQPVISFIYIPDRRTESDGSYKIAKNILYYDEVMDYYGLHGFNAHQLVVDAVKNGESWDSFVSEGNVHPDAAQGAKIASLMYNEFKTNSKKYIQNIKWNPVKGFGAYDYNKPVSISSNEITYDGNWTDDAVHDIVTEGYGLPTTMPFKTFYASNVSGAKATFKFYGTKLIVSSLMGKLGRNATYTISNKTGEIEKTGTISNYISGYDWYENVILSVEGMENTEHTLDISVGDGTGLFGIGELWVDE